MIISKDINPENDLYYWGSKIIEALSLVEGESADFFEVYNILNSDKSISMELYTLSLDWLYILGVVGGADKGSIIKCF